MKNKFKSLSSITLLIFLCSCASTDGNQSGNKRYKLFDQYIVDHQLPSINKTRFLKIQNWTPLDDRHVILSASHNNKLLITLSGYCPNLRYTNSIALKQTMANSLSSKFDSIIVADRINQECPINEIHKLTKDQVKEVIALK